MSMSLARTPRRALAGLLAAALAVLGLGAAAIPAAAQAETDRVAGDNRWGTAAEIATATFTDPDDVILATGRNFPDALAASGLAGAFDAPILLTDTDSLPTETSDALATLDPTTVHIIGGTSAVSASVEIALDDAGYVTPRYGGDDRYDTARLVGTRIESANGGAADDTAIVATGENFPDALSGGPLAYAGPHPILLVREDSLPPDTRQALISLGISNVIILGGPAAVGADVATAIGDVVDGDVTRIAGENRYETATEFASVLTALGFTLDTVLLANGSQNLGVDALAGGPHGGVVGAPILLTEEDQVPEATESFLQLNSPAIDLVRALGGEAVIAETTLDAAAADADVQLDESTSTLNELNSSGASATVTTTVAPNGALGVDIVASGMEASAVHPQHIHGLDDATANATCPPADAADDIANSPEGAADPDTLISLQEGAPSYGGVLVPLTLDDGESYPTADDAGDYTYSQSFLPSALGDLGDLAELGNRVVVLHGLTIDTTDGTAYQATLPVACGELEQPTDMTPPTITGGAAVAGDTTVEFTSDEALDAATVEVGDFTASGVGVSSVATSNGDQTITVTVDAALADGDTVTLTQDSVEDLAGNTGPASAVTVTVAAADTTAPTFVSGTSTDGDNDIVLTYTEDLDCDSIDTNGAADYTFTYTPSGGSATTINPTGASCAGDTVTVTFPGTPFGSGDSTVVDPAADEVFDPAGNAQPDDDTITIVTS